MTTPTDALPEPVALIDPRDLATGAAALHCITKPEYRSWADADAGVEYVPVCTVESARAALAAQAEAHAAVIDHQRNNALNMLQELNDMRAAVLRVNAERDALRAELDEAKRLLTHAGICQAQEEHNALRSERDALLAEARAVLYGRDL